MRNLWAFIRSLFPDWKAGVGNVVIVLLFLCIPAGVLLALWMNDARWMWLCAPILIFLS